jgi:hypothetical protein
VQVFLLSKNKRTQVLEKFEYADPCIELFNCVETAALELQFLNYNSCTTIPASSIGKEPKDL